MKVLGVIEARMNSKRLPGKVLKKIFNKTIIEIIFKRLQKCKLLDDLIVATTNSKKDNILIKLLEKKKIKFYRGNEKNVRLRLLKAIEKLEGKIVVRLTGDNPLVDPHIVDYMINYFLKKKDKLNFLTNNGYGILKNRGVPLGMDVQIFKYEDFKIMRNKYKKIKFEYPTIPFYSYKNKFNKKNLVLRKFWRFYKKPRLTVDTLDDYIVVKNIFKYLKNKGIYFTIKDIEKLYKKKPYLFSFNQHIKQKNFLY